MLSKLGLDPNKTGCNEDGEDPNTGSEEVRKPEPQEEIVPATWAEHMNEIAKGPMIDIDLALGNSLPSSNLDLVITRVVFEEWCLRVVSESSQAPPSGCLLLYLSPYIRRLDRLHWLSLSPYLFLVPKLCVVDGFLSRMIGGVFGSFAIAVAVGKFACEEDYVRSDKLSCRRPMEPKRLTSSLSRPAYAVL